MNRVGACYRAEFITAVAAKRQRRHPICGTPASGHKVPDVQDPHADVPVRTAARHRAAHIHEKATCQVRRPIGMPVRAVEPHARLELGRLGRPFQPPWRSGGIMSVTHVTLFGAAHACAALLRDSCSAKADIQARRHPVSGVAISKRSKSAHSSLCGCLAEPSMEAVPPGWEVQTCTHQSWSPDQ